MNNLDFKFTGKAFVFGDNIDTDAIIPANYLNLAEEREIALHCMEEISPGFFDRVSQGDILVAGNNFGCGSSREHAPVAIKGSGISCVVAKSFSRLFYRNAINIGLPLIIADVLPEITEGDELTLDCLSGTITQKSSGKVFEGEPLPPFMLEILQIGGLAGYLEKRMIEEGKL